jgi:hypothetical protein
MKKRHLAAILVLLMALALWGWLRKAPESRTPSAAVGSQNHPLQEEQQHATLSSPLTPSPATTAQSRSRPHASNTVVVEGVPIPQAVMDYTRNTMADPQYDWKQPINFYGKVVDENGAPVPGANIHFTWNDLSPTGTSHAETTDDESGLFSLTGQQGKRLSVTASKPGYYSAGDARAASFEYANPADGLFTPDPNNPVVFHLRKKGAGVDLITSQYGVSPDFPINIPRDGTPVNLDFFQRKIGASGQIQISESKPEHDAWRQATSWWFRMEIPDGGFVEQKDEFPFEAPESGYRAVAQFDFQQGQTNWTTGLKKDFYIKFGNPPRYGRLQVQTDISYGGAIITYAINPDGSRTLESK